jgi:hypothetical protein
MKMSSLLPAVFRPCEDPWHSLLLDAESTQSYIVAGSIKSMKNPSAIVEILTRDIPVYNAVINQLHHLELRSPGNILQHFLVNSSAHLMHSIFKYQYLLLPIQC